MQFIVREAVSSINFHAVFLKTVLVTTKKSLFKTAFAFGSWLLAGQPSLQFGYMALGCAPGGGQSNMWTVLLDGNIDLSMIMTFISSVAALCTSFL